MKNSTYLLLILLMTALAGIFIFMNNSGSANSGEDYTQNNPDAKKIVIGIKNYNYYPNTIKLKVGEPVSISLDSSVQGCFRSFTIRELNIAKYLATPKDTVEFTPNKKGTLRFACSMGMGTGTFIVE